MPMVTRIASLTLVALLLTDSFTGLALGELARPGDESKQNPFDQCVCEGEANAEDVRKDSSNPFVAPSTLIVASLFNTNCVWNDDAEVSRSARRLASPRAPPITSC